MELTNEFRVGVPVDDAWAVLTDVERIAPCLPGAQLQEIRGDVYEGIVKVKVGPITAQYKGTATFVEKDDAAHRAVLRAEGRDTRGQGNASASVTATLTPDGDGTSVSVVTDLTITGKVAQFGRGVLADVSSKLIGQFVDNLERDVLSGANAAPSAATAGAAAAAGGTGEGQAPGAGSLATAVADAPTTPPESNGGGSARKISHPEPEPVDLLATAGSPVAKRAVPVLILILVAIVAWRRRRRG
jgi:hypothetical protein